MGDGGFAVGGPSTSAPRISAVTIIARLAFLYILSGEGQLHAFEE